MAPEAVVYQQGLFDQENGNQDLYNLLENWVSDFDLPNYEEQYHHSLLQEEQITNLSPPLMSPSFSPLLPPWPAATSAAEATSSKSPRRRRARSRKSKNQDIEGQRMTHIEVERNRRKQMNEYLAVIKSLIPGSYSQRGDQASTVGGAINYVKELEHKLHSLSAQKMQASHNPEPAFGEFFNFPQYREANRVADVEVTMVESHANLKIRLRKHPKQLTHILSGLQSMGLSIIHLNVNTMNHYLLYSLSVKVEDESKANAADEIATAVYEMLGRIEEEARLSSSKHQFNFWNN